MGKDIFQRFGIPIPMGGVVKSAEEAEGVAGSLGSPVALKAQVLSGKRGKAGGVLFADDPTEARQMAHHLLGSKINDYEVQMLLVEEKLAIDREFYLGVTVDSTRADPVIILSSRGGVDIEEVSSRYIVREYLQVQWGLLPYQMRALSKRLNLDSQVAPQIEEIALSLYELFEENDADMVEINPLAVCNGRAIALDARITVDEDSRFRHPTWPDTAERTEIQDRVAQMGLSYVQMEGDIAVAANGAGITMATMDVLNGYGGEAMNFLDVGGGAAEDTVAEALRLLGEMNPRALLINIFGGITRCDEVARAIIRFHREDQYNGPVVVRLAGTNEQQGRQMLEDEGEIEVCQSMERAARTVIQLAAYQS